LNNIETVNGLVRPAYGAASLADVLPATLTALGVAGPDPLGLATGPLAGVEAVAVLLVDGLGHELLPLARRYAPTLADLIDGRLPGASLRVITTGFPSTTPTSIASLGTGAPPGSHGLVGFFLNIPGTDQVLNHIAWRDEPDPRRWQPLATQFELAARAGINARVVSRPEYSGSGLTTAAFRGADYLEASDVDTLAQRMLAGLTDRPALVYGYLSNVDAAGHDSGLDSPQWREAVAMVDQLLTILVDGLTPGSALIVTADHGQLDIPPDRRFDLDTEPGLRDGIRVVAGEPRVRYLHTLPGARDDVLATWSGVLGDAAWVVSRDEAVAAGWFGPMPEEHLQRVGDVVAVCRDDYVVLATRTDPPKVATMIAFHGSATPAEMMIPLVVVRR
jgi:hypothetical protein